MKTTHWPPRYIRQPRPTHTQGSLSAVLFVWHLVLTIIACCIALVRLDWLTGLVAGVMGFNAWINWLIWKKEDHP
jgi:hypothetical protein